MKKGPKGPSVEDDANRSAGFPIQQREGLVAALRQFEDEEFKTRLLAELLMRLHAGEDPLSFFPSIKQDVEAKLDLQLSSFLNLDDSPPSLSSITDLSPSSSTSKSEKKERKGIKKFNFWSHLSPNLAQDKSQEVSSAEDCSSSSSSSNHKALHLSVPPGPQEVKKHMRRKSLIYTFPSTKGDTNEQKEQQNSKSPQGNDVGKERQQLHLKDVREFPSIPEFTKEMMPGDSGSSSNDSNDSTSDVPQSFSAADIAAGSARAFALPTTVASNSSAYSVDKDREKADRKEDKQSNYSSRNVELIPRYLMLLLTASSFPNQPFSHIEKSKIRSSEEKEKRGIFARLIGKQLSSRPVYT